MGRWSIWPVLNNFWGWGGSVALHLKVPLPTNCRGIINYSNGLYGLIWFFPVCSGSHGYHLVSPFLEKNNRESRWLTDCCFHHTFVFHFYCKICFSFTWRSNNLIIASFKIASFQKITIKTTKDYNTADNKGTSGQSNTFKWWNHFNYILFVCWSSKARLFPSFYSRTFYWVNQF